MSTIDSDDLEATGHFLPEDSQRRPKRLRDYVEFLAHLARPRTSDEDQEWTVEIRAGEVAICVELLEEHIGRVLDELSWPAGRGERTAAVRPDAEPEAEQVAGEEPEVEEPAPDEARSRYPFGITLAQVDEFNLLIDMIRAHGDVVIANNDAEFAEYTLSVLGHAIFCDADKLRDIIRDVQLQMLRKPRGLQSGVGEERAVYRALPARWPTSGALHVLRQHPTCQ